MTATPFETAALREALADMDERVKAVGMTSADSTASDAPNIVVRRRGRRVDGLDGKSSAHLVVNDEGMLVWQFGPLGAPAGGRRGRRGAPMSPPVGDIVKSYYFDRVQPNAVSALVVKIDTMLGQGSPALRRLDTNANTFTAVAPPPSGAKKRLLIVHGTFSSVGGMLGAAPAGFWTWARATYDEVLGFDHRTLSVSPLINALDLANAFRDAQGPLDIVAHSRGGVVTRWFLEAFGAGQCDPVRAVLVGSPLDGTTLASPLKFGPALNLISNVGNAVRGTDKVAGGSWLDGATALAQVAASAVTSGGLSLAIDAAVAVIPGLFGQARVSGNAELDRLGASRPARAPRYFAITSDFASESPVWRFSKWFKLSNWTGALADQVTDGIFPGANDLVVDTDSMTLLERAGGGGAVARAIAPAEAHHFGTNDIVHHLNYFAQPDTHKKMQAWLR